MGLSRLLKSTLITFRAEYFRTVSQNETLRIYIHIWSCFFSIGLFSLSKNDNFYSYSNMRHLLLLKTFDILTLIVKVYGSYFKVGLIEFTHIVRHWLPSLLELKPIKRIWQKREYFSLKLQKIIIYFLSTYRSKRITHIMRHIG
eukprot:sb/3474034/